jgi:thiamine transport system substrate-binding protein
MRRLPSPGLPLHALAAFACALVALAGAPRAAELPTLTVYTYSSFVEEWGPGPAVKKEFEAQCSCRLDYVSLDDAVSLLTRLRLEGEATKADVVLGLDTNLTAEATATGLFAPHQLDLSGLKLPAPWTDPTFVPFDFGYFAFVYDKTKLASPPQSLAALVDGDPSQKILIEDPRTSTPGLGLLLWVRQVYGDKAGEAWRKLMPRVLTVSKSWSEAYGLFLKGEAPLVLSYTTSPAYHIVAEKNDNYAAAAFSEGHYMQIEVAGRTKSSKHPELAAQFLAFIVSPAFQDLIPTTNWMYPVAATSQPLPDAFNTLVKPAKALAYSPEEVAAHRKQWVEEWLAAMSQ